MTHAFSDDSINNDFNKYPLIKYNFPEIFFDRKKEIYMSFFVNNPTNIKVFIRLIDRIKDICLKMYSRMTEEEYKVTNFLIKEINLCLLSSNISIDIITKLIQNINNFLTVILAYNKYVFTKSLYYYLHIICLNTESLSILAEKICNEQIFPDCPICFESINKPNIFCCESSITSKEKYKHSFHATCLYAYCKLKTNFPCPICRRQCSYKQLENSYNNRSNTYQDNLLKMTNYRYRLRKEMSDLV